MKLSKKRMKIIIGLSLLVVAMALSGCGGSDSASTDHSEGVVLHLEGSDVGWPNPFKHTARGPGVARMQLLYDSLLEKDETGDIPWLAKSWELSEDGSTYTFHLQEKVTWHDGTPLTAEDVAFSFTYYKDHPPVSNDLLAGGEYIVTEAKVLDEDTVAITVNHFDNTYLTKIGTVRILPKHIWENVSDPATFAGEGATIGSGPYLFESYDAGQGAYRYVAFDDYWGLTPAAEAIEWVPVSDNVLAFENQELDLINASADILSNYQNDTSYTVKTNPSYHSYRLLMNMEAMAELQEVNIRKAIAYGIDRQELVDKVARGQADIMSMGYVPSYSEWYNANIEQYEYNSATAQELLGGKTHTFKLLTDNSADGIKTAELIKLSLEKVGVEVTIESMESKTRDNAVNTGEYELLLINSGGVGGDPDYLRTVYGTGSKTIIGWSNEAVNTLTAGQAIEQDATTRKTMIFELQEKIADEVPMILLFGARDNFVYRNETYEGWMFRYDHSKCDHNKLSYLIRE